MDWKKVLGTVAPMVGAALGGPFGGLAGTVLGSILGVDDPTDEEMLSNATKQALADPNKVMQLKEAEIAFRAKMKELDIKEQDLYLTDKQSARKMQMGTNSFIPGAISAIFLAGWILLNWYIFNSGEKIPNSDLIARVLGTADAALMLILSFWFGSSKGSQDKNAILNKT